MPTEECSNKYPMLHWDLHQLHPDSIPFHEASVYVYVILGNYWLQCACVCLTMIWRCALKYWVFRCVVSIPENGQLISSWRILRMVSSLIGSFANASSNLSWTWKTACSTSVAISGSRLSIVDRGSQCISDVFSINKAAWFCFNLRADSCADIAEKLLSAAAAGLWRVFVVRTLIRSFLTILLSNKVLVLSVKVSLVR